MEQVTNPHDKLFRETWSDRAVAQDFLRNYLPPKVAAALDLDALEIVKDSFVTPELQEYFSDLLYKVKIAERTGYVYLLFEHKSHPERWIHLQLLEYLVHIWRLHLKQRKSDGKRKKHGLPVIVPLVLYHGQEHWTAPTGFIDLFDDPSGELQRYLPQFEYILHDLTSYSDAEIRGAVRGRVALLLLKYIFDPALAHRLPTILALMQELFDQPQQDSLQYLRTFLRYVMSAADTVTEDALKTIVEQALPAYVKGGDVIMTLADRIEQRGYEKGMQQGMQQGLWTAIEVGLRIKFGDEGGSLMSLIQMIQDTTRLKVLEEKVIQARELTEVKAALLNLS